MLCLLSARNFKAHSVHMTLLSTVMTGYLKKIITFKNVDMRRLSNYYRL